MTCKECKYGELTKDIFTGGFFYLCTNECEIPFGSFGDMQIPSSKTVIDCPFGEKRGLSLAEPNPKFVSELSK